MTRTRRARWKVPIIALKRSTLVGEAAKTCGSLSVCARDLMIGRDEIVSIGARKPYEMAAVVRAVYATQTVSRLQKQMDKRCEIIVRICAHNNLADRIVTGMHVRR
jgi:hypothetical protein